MKFSFEQQQFETRQITLSEAVRLSELSEKVHVTLEDLYKDLQPRTLQILTGELNEAVKCHERAIQEQSRTNLHVATYKYVNLLEQLEQLMKIAV